MSCWSPIEGDIHITEFKTGNIGDGGDETVV
jgi:hypothetical protein